MKMLSRTLKVFSPKLFYNCNKCTLKYCKYSTISNIDKTLIEKYISHLEDEYEKISKIKSLDSRNEQRMRELARTVQFVQERKRLAEHLSNLNLLLKENDEDMKKLAKEETELYQKKITDIEQDLLDSLIPADNQDECHSIVLEVNAGVGGQEAMLFARELLDMYVKFAEYKGWCCQLAELDSTDIGGVRHASAFISGHRVFRYLKYEGGVHRVQRIPSTERAGRVHTSTVSIVALPQPTDVQIHIQDKDVRVETKRASGAGGQHVNTTDSAVRLVHLPTGLAVECQVDRSQIKNRQMAMQRLKAKLYDLQMNAQLAQSEATRKSQVRSNFRNEKIRTYNFSQDRITDHRLQGANMHNLRGFLLGGQALEALIDKLHSASQYEQLRQILNSVHNNK